MQNNKNISLSIKKILKRQHSESIIILSFSGYQKKKYFKKMASRSLSHLSCYSGFRGSDLQRKDESNLR